MATDFRKYTSAFFRNASLFASLPGFVAVSISFPPAEQLLFALFSETVTSCVKRVKSSFQTGFLLIVLKEYNPRIAIIINPNTPADTLPGKNFETRETR